VWRRQEPPLDRETVDGIIRMLMAINAKLDRLVGWGRRTIPRKIDPDDRRRYEAQSAEWARTAREFEANYVRLKARVA
jgi:chromosome condensin MukBEF complex kleisin-like MukF subunit